MTYSKFTETVTGLVLILALSACADQAEVESALMSRIIDDPLTQPSIPATDPDGFKTYPTTTGGYISVIRSARTPLASGQILRGFTTDSGTRYALIKRDAGGGIKWWDIYKSPLGEDGYRLHCSLLDDGTFTGGLQKNAAHFYIKAGDSSSRRYRRFNVSNCAEQSPVTVPTFRDAEGFYEASFATLFALDGTDLFLPARNDYGITRLKKYSQTNFSISTVARVPKIGEEDVRWDRSFALAPSSLWTYTACASSNDWCLWKLDRQGNAIGWTHLPSADYPALTYHSSSSVLVVAIDDRKISIVVPEQTEFKVFTLNVTGF